MIGIKGALVRVCMGVLVCSFFGYSDLLQVEASKIDVEHNYSLLNSNTQPTGFVIDSQDNIYVGGEFTGSVDFDPTSADDTITSSGKSLYVSKFSQTGQYIFTKTTPSQNGDVDMIDIVIDNNDNIYYGGRFRNTFDFSTTGTPESYTSDSGSFDGFVSKMDSTGDTEFTYVIGGNFNEFINDLETTSNNDLMIMGDFATTTMDFDPTSGVDTNSKNNNTSSNQAFQFETFVTKINSNAQYEYTNIISGSNPNTVYDNQMATGYLNDNTHIMFNSRTSGSGVINIVINGSTILPVDDAQEEVFIIEFDPDGDLITKKTVGYGGFEVEDIEIDSNGDYYMGGTFSNTITFPNNGNPQSFTPIGDEEPYFYKLDSDGGYVFAEVIEGADSSDEIYAESMLIDEGSNKMYLTGSSYGAANFDDDYATKEIDSTNSVSYIAVYDLAGSFQKLYTFDNVSGSDINGVLRDSDSGLFILGSACSDLDTDPSENDNVISPANGCQPFVTKLNEFFRYFVQDIDSALAVELISGESVDDQEDVGVVEGNTESLLLRNGDNGILAQAEAAFNSDLDWSGVAGATDAANNMAFVHNLSTAPGVTGNYTMYVPFAENMDAMIICPGVSSFADISPECAGAERLPLDDARVTIEELEGTMYYAVSDISGTGIMLQADEADEEETQEPTTDNSTLIRTGGY